MKKLAYVGIILLTGINLALVFHDFDAAGTFFGPDRSLIKGLDLIMRRNEAQCVMDGVDPYLVWTQQIVREPYYPYVRQDLLSECFYEPINAYTPWEYPFAMLYAVLPKQVAWGAHFALMLVSFMAIVLFAWRKGGPWASVAVLLFVMPANVDINVGNYALIVTFAIVGMLSFLKSGRDLFAGVCWIFAMFKPQLGVLLAIPLLLRGRWRVCVTSGLLCALLLIFVSVLCGVSPVVLLREAPAASVHAFEGCALMPPQLLDIISTALPDAVLLSIPMCMGVIACAVLTWHVRKSDDWLILVTPSLLCAVAWTYVQPHSYVLLMPVAAVFVADIAERPTVGRICLGVSAIMFMARFPRGVEIVSAKLIPVVTPIAHSFTLISATVAFLLSVVYVWKYLPMSEDTKIPRDL